MAKEVSKSDFQKPVIKRNKCPACFKQYNRKDHFVEHVRVSGHSVHQPQCGVCGKYCKSFESLREHLTGPLSRASCATIFKTRGCSLCMNVFDSPDVLTLHEECCRMSPAIFILFELEKACNNFSSVKSGVEDFDLVEEYHGDESRKVVALDCEMVGGGSDGTLDLCGRVCLIDEDENVIFHSYVIPKIPVTDFRYDVTGITGDHLTSALPLEQVREKVEEILHNEEAIWKMRLKGGKAMILVGHNIERDLDCLQMNYPEHLQRDTANYPPLMKTNLASHSLKYLTKTYLGYEIQSGIHNPYEDCVAAMRLYKRMRSRAHKQEGHLISTTDGDTCNDVWSQKNLDRMTLDSLFAISQASYRCWCLDLVRQTDS